MVKEQYQEKHNIYIHYYTARGRGSLGAEAGLSADLELAVILLPGAGVNLVRSTLGGLSGPDPVTVASSAAGVTVAAAGQVGSGPLIVGAGPGAAVEVGQLHG